MMNTIFGLAALSELQEVVEQAADAAASASINSERFICIGANCYSRPDGRDYVVSRRELFFHNLLDVVREFLDNNLVNSGTVHISNLKRESLPLSLFP